MFTFICLGTRDLTRAAIFYDATMATLGHSRCDVSAEPGWEGWMGWGTYEQHGAKELALWLCPPFNDDPSSVGNGTMVVFSAKSWAQVDSFRSDLQWRNLRGQAQFATALPARFLCGLRA